MQNQDRVARRTKELKGTRGGEREAGRGRGPELMLGQGRSFLLRREHSRTVCSISLRPSSIPSCQPAISRLEIELTVKGH